MQTVWLSIVQIVIHRNGYIPTLIKSDTLPLDRQDVFGTIFQHEEEKQKKIIPIKVVNEIVGVVNEVPVYGKSRLETS